MIKESGMAISGFLFLLYRKFLRLSEFAGGKSRKREKLANERSSFFYRKYAFILS